MLLDSSSSDSDTSDDENSETCTSATQKVAEIVTEHSKVHITTSNNLEENKKDNTPGIIFLISVLPLHCYCSVFFLSLKFYFLGKEENIASSMNEERVIVEKRTEFSGKHSP